jgi:hypothetical protein
MEAASTSEIFEISARLHGYKYQKSVIFTVPAAGASNMDVLFSSM